MEEWRSIPDYPAYEVSSDGRVRSRLRSVVQRNRWGQEMACRRAAKALKPQIKKGYEQVALCSDGVKRWLHVHTVVAAAFVGARPDGHVIRHINGDRRDNRAENLRYGTYHENAEDMLRHGTRLRGEQGIGAKLSSPEVLKIRATPKGVPQAEIARQYGINQTTVSSILRRKTWSHI